MCVCQHVVVDCCYMYEYVCVCVSMCTLVSIFYVVVVEHSPNGFIYNKNPALSAQGSLQKEGERHWKSQRKKTYSCESVSNRNVRRNTPII